MWKFYFLGLAALVLANISRKLAEGRQINLYSFHAFPRISVQNVKYKMTTVFALSIRFLICAKAFFDKKKGAEYN